ncbi:MAG: CBS domain-containing protein [Gammaproteobacteria bacterium]
MTERKIIRVRDAMKREYDVVDGMATIREALKIMHKLNAECLIVDKRHKDDEYGMLLISDVARNVLARDRAPDRVNVYEVMAKPVISVDPDMDIRYCARLFDKFEITRAPVIANDQVVGIVSFNDLVIHGMSEQD